MKITLTGASNARDLGGITTPFGKVKFRRLIRCGHLSKITTNDAQILLQNKLARVVDLRTPLEQAKSPDIKIEGVQYITNPIISATTFGITYEKSSGEEIGQMLQAGIARMIARGDDPKCHLQILYRKFVNEQISRDGYGAFLKLLANNPVDGATLWHCSAGKDRVGTCTALLLHCLGATKQQIMDDYLLTNVQSKPFLDMVMSKISGKLNAEQISLIQGMLSVKEEYLQAFWEEIDLKFGDIDRFICACGITQSDIEKLRKNYLE